MSAFHVGQKVVCINGSPWPGRPIANYLTLPEVGAVYTVRWVGTHQWACGSIGEGIKVEGINRHGLDAPFTSERFRPVAYPKQSLAHDVAQFLKIADRAPAPKKRAGVRA